MVLTYKYQSPLKHKKKWYQGYNIECSNFKENKGPKNGSPIKITNLPHSDSVYVRFWGAKHNKDDLNWENFKKAYDEKSKYESEPSISYFNGGVVKADKKGIVRFRLILPSGYKNKDGLVENPHFHYRVCNGNKMGGVTTQFITHSTDTEKLYVYKKL